MSTPINVAVVGASGYTGLELLKILTVHPMFNVTYIGTSEGGEAVENMHPSLLHVATGVAQKSDASSIAKVASLAFFGSSSQGCNGICKRAFSSWGKSRGFIG